MFKLFKKQQPVDLSVLVTDIHSHLLPGIDDGARVFDDSLEMIRALIQLGYKKLITTPHIMQDYYPNTPEIILTKLEELKIVLKENDLNIEVEVAAEYYLDEFLMEKLDNTDQLLTFGKNYILFEMSFYNESPFIKDFIFKIKSSGLTPVLAHAERYSYYSGNLDKIEDLVERGALIQMNINSISGVYSKPVTKLAEAIIDSKLVHFLGSDCHHISHIDGINKTRLKKYCEKALNLPLLNSTL